MTALLKLIYTFNTNPIKIPQIFFSRNCQPHPKFIWKYREARVVKQSFTRKKVRGLICIDIKFYCKAIVINMLHKGRHIDL